MVDICVSNSNNNTKHKGKTISNKKLSLTGGKIASKRDGNSRVSTLKQISCFLLRAYEISIHKTNNNNKKLTSPNSSSLFLLHQILLLSDVVVVVGIIHDFGVDIEQTLLLMLPVD